MKPATYPPMAETFFRQMQTIRRFEETALELFAQGALNGTVHTCIGQEACAVGVVNALDHSRDVIFSNHRGHGHFLAWCDDVNGLMAELLGRAEGVCGAVGGTQHLHTRGFYSNGIQGGIVPLATGCAYAEKRRGKSAVTTVFIGDGTLGEGVVYESFNVAARKELPILFVIENNGYAQTTPAGLVHAGKLSERGAPFGIESVSLAADDVFQVYRATVAQVGYVRSKTRPAILYLETYRLAPHSKGDDFRPADEIVRARAADPLAALRATLPDSLAATVAADVDRRITRAVFRARELPARTFPEYRAGMVAQGVYGR